MLDDASVRDPGPCRCQHFRPSGDEGTRLSTAPQGAFARSVSTQSVRHAEGALAQQAPERAAQRYKSGLTALRGTESLISCREARWSRRALRTVCGVVRLSAQLLAHCRDVLLGFLPGSKRTVHLDCVPGEVLRA